MRKTRVSGSKGQGQTQKAKGRWGRGETSQNFPHNADRVRKTAAPANLCRGGWGIGGRTPGVEKDPLQEPVSPGQRKTQPAKTKV